MNMRCAQEGRSWRRNVGVLAGVILIVALTAGAQESLVVSQTLGGSGIVGPAGEYYYAGATIEVWVTISQEYPAEITGLRFEAVLPEGWTYLGAGGSDLPQVTPLNTTGTLVFHWLGTQVLPKGFWYRVLAPLGDGGPQTITGTAYGRVGEVQAVSEVFTSTVDLDREAPVITLLGSSAMTIDCGAYFLDPGATAQDNANGDISSWIIRSGDWVNTSAPGRYTLTYNATDSSGNDAIARNRLVVVLENCPGDYCEDECAVDPGKDSDGDGLTDCEERCQYGTNPELLDTDGDGMGDAYEVRYAPSLDPNNAGDRNADPDGDGLTNFEEFLRGSSPVDPGDPERVYYVAPPPQGVDDEDGGTFENPWATIGFALEHAVASAEYPATIILLGGTYEEDVILRAYITLTGAPGMQSIISGSVTGANNSVLSNLEVRALDPADVLLNLLGAEPDFAGVAMKVSGVTFRNGAIGILMGGASSGGATITGCTFTGMNVAIEIRGALPTVRRCFFENLVVIEKGNAVGIYIRALPAKQAGGSLGDVTDPGAGWNTFDTETIPGYAVVNERAEEIKMEENDWGTDDPDAVAAAIAGPSDFEPFLAKGSGILAAAIYCTVWDADTLERIVNGSVQLVPSTYAPVTQNSNGVYSFPAVASGSYSVNVSAPDYAAKSAVVLVADGEVASVIVALSKAEVAPPGCCSGNKSVKLSDNPGDVLLGILAFLALVGMNRFMRRDP